MADNKKESASELTPLGFLYRFLASLALVMFTYNPSGFSAYHWITGAIGASSFGPLHLLLIAALLIGWTILLVATARSLNGFGIFLVGLVLAGIIWLLMDLGILSPEGVSGYTWDSFDMPRHCSYHRPHLGAHLAQADWPGQRRQIDE